MSESTKEDAETAEARVGGGGAVVVVDGSRENSCDDNNRNTNYSSSSSSTSGDSGVSIGGSVIDVGAVGGSSDSGSGVAGGRLSCRGGSLRLVIKGPVEGPVSSGSDSRVAARVQNPSWKTGARGVDPSAASGRRGCPAVDGVPGRNVAVGATTRNRSPMGANLTKQSRVSSISPRGSARARLLK